ncbi:hypothetical protein BST36_12015 [Mycolicibacterium moriokaense]|nr:YdcF family protein [Mycolicibacterium moriokaense]ORB23769.1 hypothetical protein BST36_12015 [Mycolicibacterium moriokaense]
MARGTVIVLAVLLAIVIGLAADIVAFSRQSDAAHADAAVVLGAAVADGGPTPVFAERLRHAAGLFKAGQVDWIVVTGGVGHGDSVAEADAGRDWLIRAGVPADRILVESRSRTTRQNLLFTQPVLAEHGLGRVLIVSDPLHMRRAMRMAADLGLDAHPSPTRTSGFKTLGTQVPMLLRELYFSLQYHLTLQ